MSEHTPGPWKAKPAIDPQWVIETKDTFVCQTLGGNDEPNAHLIAAAPDLLEACEAMLALVKVCSKHYRSSDEHSAIEQANAAIAKAQPPRCIMRTRKLTDKEQKKLDAARKEYERIISCMCVVFTPAGARVRLIPSPPPAPNPEVRDE